MNEVERLYETLKKVQEPKGYFLFSFSYASGPYLHYMSRVLQDESD